MVNILRDRYKVQKKDHEKAFEYQLGLKYNEEYEKVVEEAFLKIVKIFIGKYPGVKLDPPRGREKSDKSLENKIKKLAIERLSKKYSINEITNEELDTLYNLITEKVKNRNSIDEDNILEEIDKIFFKSIKDLDSISYIIEREDISDNTKKALLRMVYSKLIIQNDKDSKKMQNEIEYRYGEKAAEREKCDSKNLLHWEDIEILLENDEELKKVYDSFEYLRVKDLRAFKIIISSVPDDIKTDNKKLKEYLEKREKAKDDRERFKYNDLCCIEVEKEFAKELIENNDLLDSLGVMVIKDGYKQKSKENGYIADHIKFAHKEHPEYIFELQLRSMYREDLSRVNGPAAHDKRDGKIRVFPDTDNKDIFLKQSKYMTPKYKIIKRTEKGLSVHRCTEKENLLEYYLGYIDTNSEEYKKAIEYLNEESTQTK